ncbi:MAG: hypothetical protein AAGB19_10720 [Cyanobacteria bacterium P01_F01_bin.3]
MRLLPDVIAHDCQYVVDESKVITVIDLAARERSHAPFGCSFLVLPIWV